MSKEFTKMEYYDYMKVVDGYIKDAEWKINYLPKYKEIRQLSFEDWVKFQNGELKIENKGDRSMAKLIESNKKFDEKNNPKKDDRDSYEGGFDSSMWLSTI